MITAFKYLEEDIKFLIIAGIICAVIIAAAVSSLRAESNAGTGHKIWAQASSQQR